MKLSTKGRYAVMAMVDLARHAQAKPVSLSDIQPGVVVTYYSDASHAAIYIGDGLQMNAYQSGKPYGVTSVGKSDFWGAIRLW